MGMWRNASFPRLRFIINSPSRDISMSYSRLIPLMLLAFCFQANLVVRADWELGPTGTKASLRGLHACNDLQIWACGSQGTVIRSSDGGSSWTECGPDKFGDLEFRSIHAWDAQSAIVASAGSPAVILLTTNGGESWEVAYENKDPAAFFDALKFWTSKRGLAFSDPVAGRLLVVETFDGGKSWRESEGMPASASGEAGFAASNSGLCVDSDGNAWVGTGGADAETSRVYHRPAGASSWTVQECPLASSATNGVFSIAHANVAEGKLLVAVGGDYRPNEISHAVAAFSVDQGQSWTSAPGQPSAFRSSVVAFTPESSGENGGAIWICTGPTGSDFSVDGKNWHSLSERGFHVLASSELHIFAAGSDGRFAAMAKRDVAESISTINRKRKLQADEK